MTTISKMTKAQLKDLADDLLTADRIKSSEVEMLKDIAHQGSKANWDMWDSNTRLMGENSRLKHENTQLHFMVGSMFLVGVVIGAVGIAFIGI